MDSETVSAVVELLLMSTALILLLYLAHLLSAVGVFTHIDVTYPSPPPLLVALLPPNSTPPSLHNISLLPLLAAASSRGVVPDPTPFSSPPPIARAHLVSFFSPQQHPFTPTPVRVGLVLDTGPRVTEEACDQWTKRLQGKNITGLEVRKVTLPKMACVEMGWGGRAIEKVALWRGIRRVKKRRSKHIERRGTDPLCVYVANPDENKSRILMPLNATKTFINI